MLKLAHSHMILPNTTIPIMATAINVVTLVIANKLFTIVPHCEPIAFCAITIQTHINATSLSAQKGVLSFGFKDQNRTRLMYSPKMMASIAAETGFVAVIVVQENKKAERGPNT